MWVKMFLCLFAAHLVADFILQSNSICKNKAIKKWHSPYHYEHAIIVFALSWLVSMEVGFWWCALIIGVSHFLIDIWKSYREEEVEWFAIDQVLHILVLIGISILWSSSHIWTIPWGASPGTIATIVAFLVCWKPSNIFIKLMLKHFSVSVPETEDKSGFNAGALIGDIERWLIILFVCMQHYEALGLLIAAKSIIRFSDKDTTKTEYVLAGTLLSIFIAVLSGLFVCHFLQK